MNRTFFGNIPSHSLLFERFTLLRCLSAGQYGGVYLCSDRGQRNRQVVIKIMSKQTCYDQALLARFFEEIKLTKGINHPNVMSCKEWMNDEEFIAYSMDYMSGGSLADIIEDKANLQISQIINILHQLCNGVQAIHNAGVVHRDIKPENILISSSGNLKICDFGIAANMGVPNIADNDAIMGSMNYLSPEYVADGSFDQRSDIYSIGVVAYELIAKRLPFEGEDLLDTLRQRVCFNPSSPSKYRQDLPPALNRWVLRALSKNPKERYQTCEAMINALDLVTDNAEVQSKTSLMSLFSKLLPSA